MFRKTLLAAVAALTLFATPAFALNQFYDVTSGNWKIEGYTGEKNFCSAKTFWADGSYVSLFNMRGSNTFSLYVHNKDWDIAGDFGSTYSGRMEFTGSAGSDQGTMQFELKDSKTIIVRNLTDSFLRNWIIYRTMIIVMPNDIPNMAMDLTGTSSLVNSFNDCIDHLN